MSIGSVPGQLRKPPPLVMMLAMMLIIVSIQSIDDRKYNSFVSGWTMAFTSMSSSTSKARIPTSMKTVLTTTNNRRITKDNWRRTQRLSGLQVITESSQMLGSFGSLTRVSATPESLFGNLDEPTTTSKSMWDDDSPTTPRKKDGGDGNNNNSDNYPTHDSIDWSDFNPFEGLSWQEYEEKYVYNADGTTPLDDIEWDPSVPTFNQLHVVGRVGNIGELRYLGGGPASASGGSGDPATGNSNNQNSVVLQMSVASPRYYNYFERRDLNVEYGQEETEWYNCEIWGQLAEFVSKNVRKGMRVGIIGAIDTDFYENRRDGADSMLATNLKVIVQDLDILESKMESDARQENQRGPSFYTNDDDDYGGGYGGGGGASGSSSYNDTYDPSSGSSGGFFDP